MNRTACQNSNFNTFSKLIHFHHLSSTAVCKDYFQLSKGTSVFKRLMVTLVKNGCIHLIAALTPCNMCNGLQSKAPLTSIDYDGNGSGKLRNATADKFSTALSMRTFLWNVDLFYLYTSIIFPPSTSDIKSRHLLWKTFVWIIWKEMRFS